MTYSAISHNYQIFLAYNDVILALLPPLSITLTLASVFLYIRARNRSIFNRGENSRSAVFLNRNYGNSLRRSTKNPRLEQYASFLEPRDTKERATLATKLQQAGIESEDAVRLYHLTQIATGTIACLIGATCLLAWQGAPTNLLDPTLISLWIITPGCFGYVLPKYIIFRRQKKNIQRFANEFPDALDCLLVCIEAGQSIDQAINYLSRDLRIGYPRLAAEFERVSLSLRAGDDRKNVLREMARRTGVPDIQAFATVLIQSSEFGTPIADALRVFSSEMRDKRFMRAEELANTLPTKMTLAAMILTVPPLLLILVGPAVLEIYNTFSTSGF